MGHCVGCQRGQVQPLGGLSMGRWSVRTSLASPEPRGDSHVAHLLKRVTQAGSWLWRWSPPGPWRRSAASVGRQPDRGPAGRWQGGARLCGGLRRGAVATRWQRRSGGGRAGGKAMEVPASRSPGAGTGVFGCNVPQAGSGGQSTAGSGSQHGRNNSTGTASPERDRPAGLSPRGELPAR